MRLLSVNTGEPRSIPNGDEAVLTAIFKTPRPGRVSVRQDHLDGDRQADTRFHGGANKAVYAYPCEHYAHWASELERDDFTHGQFGENLTTTGLLEDEVRIGDVLSIGSAVLQVTQPRKPCFKLGLRMGLATFPKQFVKSGRTGFYSRVLEPGEIGAGDPIERVSVGEYGFTIAALWRLVFVDKADCEGARRALEIPWLAPEFRDPLRRRIQRATAGE